MRLVYRPARPGSQPGTGKLTILGPQSSDPIQIVSAPALKRTGKRFVPPVSSAGPPSSSSRCVPRRRCARALTGAECSTSCDCACVRAPLRSCPCGRHRGKVTVISVRGVAREGPETEVQGKPCDASICAGGRARRPSRPQLPRLLTSNAVRSTALGARRTRRIVAP